MNKGKFVYAQIVEFLPQRVFDTIVLKYDGNRYVKHFTCWNQLLVMVFGQLTNRDSLRDLIVAIEELTTEKVIISVLGKVLPEVISQKQMRIAITGSLKSLLII